MCRNEVFTLKQISFVRNRNPELPGTKQVAEKQLKVFRKMSVDWINQILPDLMCRNELFALNQISFVRYRNPKLPGTGQLAEKWLKVFRKISIDKINQI